MMRSLLLVLFLLLFIARGAWAQSRELLLPLDDRPSTLLFVRQIGRIGGAEMLTPPRKMLGCSTAAGDCRALSRWLLKASWGAEYSIVSSDMLCYGGLVASRSASVSGDDAVSRLSVLRSIRRRGASIDVLATIPRLALRTSDRQAPYEYVLQRWAAQGACGVPENVPEDVVAEYLGVRSRNYRVILALIDLAEAHVIDRLIIGQDDASSLGPNMKEQQEINAEIRRRHLSGKVMMMSGADELAMNMTAGWLSRKSGIHPRIAVEYDRPEEACEVPPLESQSLRKTVSDHLALSGAFPAFKNEEADATLLIATPQEEGDPCGGEAAESASNIASRLLSIIKTGMPSALADLQHLNMADRGLSDALIARVPLWRLESFSGWNTPSNALGTAIAQTVAHRILVRQGRSLPLSRVLEGERTHQAFLLARFIDDYRYQAVVREAVRPEADALPAGDPLLNLLGPSSVTIRESLIPWGLALFRRSFLNRHIPLPGKGKVAIPREVRLQAVLPWRRVFEVELQADMTLEVRERPSAPPSLP